MLGQQRTASFVLDPAFERRIPAIVTAHLPDILGEEAGIARSISIAVSAPFLVNDDRHHRVARIRYRSQGRPRQTSIWLKFRPALEAAYESHRRAYMTPGWDRSFLPRPYFCHREADESLCVVGLEHVPGMTMRRAVLLAALIGDRERIGALMRGFGARLRSFHDRLVTPDARGVAAMTERLTAAIDGSPWIDAAERRRAIANAAQARDVVGRDASLQLTRSHNDPTMRNIILRPDGSPTLVDCDSLQRPGETRWHDVAHFLLNLESTIRYFPLFGPAFIARLSAAFMDGYRGPDYPDQLSPARAHAVLYLVKAEFMLGLGHRAPFLATYDNLLGRRFRKLLMRELADGACLAAGAMRAGLG